MKQGLLFMPDISGFTAFVQQTEINHSKHIVKELLELLIDQNMIGLQLAEIEGDALFFYKENANTTPSELAEQIKRMYQAFHQHLLIYKYRRVCNCGACTSAEGLQLKFVVHEAKIEFIEVKKHKKPFGQEVIKVHRLLKNKVPEQEYALFSSEYLESNSSELTKVFGAEATLIDDEFDFGLYQYGYNSLSGIRRLEAPDKRSVMPQLGRHILRRTIQMSHQSNDVFQFILDFDKRSLWSEGVDRLVYDETKINRVGAEHTCVIGNKEISLSTLYANIEGEDLVFVESTEDAPLIRNLSSVFRVSSTTTGSTLQVDFYTKSKSFLGKLMMPLLRIKLGGNTDKSLNGLKKALADRQ